MAIDNNFWTQETNIHVQINVQSHISNYELYTIPVYPILQNHKKPNDFIVYKIIAKVILKRMIHVTELCSANWMHIRINI